MSSSEEDKCVHHLTEEAFDQFLLSLNHGGDESIDDTDDEDYEANLVEEITFDARDNLISSRKANELERRLNDRQRPKCSDNLGNINDRPGPSHDRPSCSSSSSELMKRLIDRSGRQGSIDNLDRPGPSRGKSGDKSSKLMIRRNDGINNLPLSNIEPKTNKRPSSPHGSDDVPKKKKTEFEPPKLKEPNRDIFCWKCHRFGTDTVICINCPRVYHLKCNQVGKVSNWVCLQCEDIRQQESDERPPSLKNINSSQFSELLTFVLRRLRQHGGCVHFEQNVNTSDYPEYLLYIVHPLCLSDIEAKISQNGYKSCEAFLADIRWLVHNSYIFNTAQAEYTVIAKSLLKMATQECREILDCPNCYLHANTLDEKERFIEPCNTPHILIWAKLKGYPYWPGKVMGTSGNNIDVRFFGDYNRSIVPVEFCYLFSKQMPKKQKWDSDLELAIEEVTKHIEKLKQKFGEFCYPPAWIPLAPKNEDLQRKLLLPGFKPPSLCSFIGPPNVKKPKLMEHDDVKPGFIRVRDIRTLTNYTEINANSSNSQISDSNPEESSLKTHTFPNNLSIHIERYDVREQNLHPNKRSSGSTTLPIDNQPIPTNRKHKLVEQIEDKTKKMEDISTDDNEQHKDKPLPYKRPSRDYKAIVKSIQKQNYKVLKSRNDFNLSKQCFVSLQKINIKEKHLNRVVEGGDRSTSLVGQHDHSDHLTDLSSEGHPHMGPLCKRQSLLPTPVQESSSNEKNYMANNCLDSNTNAPEENKISELIPDEFTKNEVKIKDIESILNEGLGCSRTNEKNYRERYDEVSEGGKETRPYQTMKRQCNKSSLQPTSKNDSHKRDATGFMNYHKKTKLNKNSIRAKLVKNNKNDVSIIFESFQNKLPSQNVQVQNRISSQDNISKEIEKKTISLSNTARLTGSIPMKTFQSSEDTREQSNSSHEKIHLVNEGNSSEEGVPNVFTFLNDIETLTLGNSTNREVLSPKIDERKISSSDNLVVIKDSDDESNKLEENIKKTCKASEIIFASNILHKKLTNTNSRKENIFIQQNYDHLPLEKGDSTYVPSPNKSFIIRKDIPMASHSEKAILKGFIPDETESSGVSNVSPVQSGDKFEENISENVKSSKLNNVSPVQDDKIQGKISEGVLSSVSSNKLLQNKSFIIENDIPTVSPGEMAILKDSIPDDTESHEVSNVSSVKNSKLENKISEDVKLTSSVVSNVSPVQSNKQKEKISEGVKSSGVRNISSVFGNKGEDNISDEKKTPEALDDTEVKLLGNNILNKALSLKKNEILNNESFTLNKSMIKIIEPDIINKKFASGSLTIISKETSPDKRESSNVPSNEVEERISYDNQTSEVRDNVPKDNDISGLKHETKINLITNNTSPFMGEEASNQLNISKENILNDGPSCSIVKDKGYRECPPDVLLYQSQLKKKVIDLADLIAKYTNSVEESKTIKCDKPPVEYTRFKQLADFLNVIGICKDGGTDSDRKRNSEDASKHMKEDHVEISKPSKELENSISSCHRYVPNQHFEMQNTECIEEKISHGIENSNIHFTNSASSNDCIPKISFLNSEEMSTLNVNEKNKSTQSDTQAVKDRNPSDKGFQVLDSHSVTEITDGSSNQIDTSLIVETESGTSLIVETESCPVEDSAILKDKHNEVHTILDMGSTNLTINNDLPSKETSQVIDSQSVTEITDGSSNQIDTSLIVETESSTSLIVETESGASLIVETESCPVEDSAILKDNHNEVHTILDMGSTNLAINNDLPSKETVQFENNSFRGNNSLKANDNSINLIYEEVSVEEITEQSKDEAMAIVTTDISEDEIFVRKETSQVSDSPSVSEINENSSNQIDTSLIVETESCSVEDSAILKDRYIEVYTTSDMGSTNLAINNDLPSEETSQVIDNQSVTEINENCSNQIGTSLIVETEFCPVEDSAILINMHIEVHTTLDMGSTNLAINNDLPSKETSEMENSSFRENDSLKANDNSTNLIYEEVSVEEIIEKRKDKAMSIETTDNSEDGILVRRETSQEINSQSVTEITDGSSNQIDTSLIVETESCPVKDSAILIDRHIEVHTTFDMGSTNLAINNDFPSKKTSKVIDSQSVTEGSLNQIDTLIVETKFCPLEDSAILRDRHIEVHTTLDMERTNLAINNDLPSKETVELEYNSFRGNKSLKSNDNSTPLVCEDVSVEEITEISKDKAMSIETTGILEDEILVRRETSQVIDSQSVTEITDCSSNQIDTSLIVEPECGTSLIAETESCPVEDSAILKDKHNEVHTILDMGSANLAINNDLPSKETVQFENNSLRGNNSFKANDNSINLIYEEVSADEITKKSKDEAMSIETTDISEDEILVRRETSQIIDSPSVSEINENSSNQIDTSLIAETESCPVEDSAILKDKHNEVHTILDMGSANLAINNDLPSKETVQFENNSLRGNNSFKANDNSINLIYEEVSVDEITKKSKDEAMSIETTDISEDEILVRRETSQIIDSPSVSEINENSSNQIDTSLIAETESCPVEDSAILKDKHNEVHTILDMGSANLAINNDLPSKETSRVIDHQSATGIIGIRGNKLSSKVNDKSTPLTHEVFPVEDCNTNNAESSRDIYLFEREQIQNILKDLRVNKTAANSIVNKIKRNCNIQIETHSTQLFDSSALPNSKELKEHYPNRGEISEIITDNAMSIETAGTLEDERLSRQETSQVIDTHSVTFNEMFEFNDSSSRRIDSSSIVGDESCPIEESPPILKDRLSEREVIFQDTIKKPVPNNEVHTILGMGSNDVSINNDVSSKETVVVENNSCRGNKISLKANRSTHLTNKVVSMSDCNTNNVETSRDIYFYERKQIANILNDLRVNKTAANSIANKIYRNLNIQLETRPNSFSDSEIIKDKASSIDTAGTLEGENNEMVVSNDSSSKQINIPTMANNETSSVKSTAKKVLSDFQVKKRSSRSIIVKHNRQSSGMKLLCSQFKHNHSTSKKDILSEFNSAQSDHSDQPIIKSSVISLCKRSASSNDASEVSVLSKGEKSKLIEKNQCFLDADHDYCLLNESSKEIINKKLSVDKSLEQDVSSEYKTLLIESDSEDINFRKGETYENKAVKRASDVNIKLHVLDKENKHLDKKELYNTARPDDNKINQLQVTGIEKHSKKYKADKIQQEKKSNENEELSNFSTSNTNILNAPPKIDHFLNFLEKNKNLSKVIKSRIVENTKRRINIDKVALLRPEFQEKETNSVTPLRANSSCSNLVQSQILYDRLSSGYEICMEESIKSSQTCRKGNNSNCNTSQINNGACVSSCLSCGSSNINVGTRVQKENISINNKTTTSNEREIIISNLDKNNINRDFKDMNNKEPHAVIVDESDGGILLISSDDEKQVGNENSSEEESDSASVNGDPSFFSGSCSQRRGPVSQVDTESSSSDTLFEEGGDLSSFQPGPLGQGLPQQGQPRGAEVYQLHGVTQPLQDTSQGHQKEIIESLINYYSGARTHNDKAKNGSLIIIEPQLKEGIESVHEHYTDRVGVQNRNISVSGEEKSDLDDIGYRAELEELECEYENIEDEGGHRYNEKELDSNEQELMIYNDGQKEAMTNGVETRSDNKGKISANDDGEIRPNNDEEYRKNKEDAKLNNAETKTINDTEESKTAYKYVRYIVESKNVESESIERGKIFRLQAKELELNVVKLMTHKDVKENEAKMDVDDFNESGTYIDDVGSDEENCIISKKKPIEEKFTTDEDVEEDTAKIDSDVITESTTDVDEAESNQGSWISSEMEPVQQELMADKNNEEYEAKIDYQDINESRTDIDVDETESDQDSCISSDQELIQQKRFTGFLEGDEAKIDESRTDIDEVDSDQESFILSEIESTQEVHMVDKNNEEYEEKINDHDSTESRTDIDETESDQDSCISSEQESIQQKSFIDKDLEGDEAKIDEFRTDIDERDSDQESSISSEVESTQQVHMADKNNEEYEAMIDNNYNKECMTDIDEVDKNNEEYEVMINDDDINESMTNIDNLEEIPVDSETESDHIEQSITNESLFSDMPHSIVVINRRLWPEDLDTDQSEVEKNKLRDFKAYIEKYFSDIPRSEQEVISSDEEPWTDNDEGPRIGSDEDPVADTDDEEPWTDNDEGPRIDSDEDPVADTDEEEPWTDNDEGPNIDEGEPRIVYNEVSTIDNNKKCTFLRIDEEPTMDTDDEEPTMDTDDEEPITDTDDEEHRIDNNDEEPSSYNYDEEPWTENEEGPYTDFDEGEPRIVNIKEPAIDNSEECSFLRIDEEPRIDTDDEEPRIDTDDEEPRMDTDDEEPRMDTDYEEPMTDTDDEEPRMDTDYEEPMTDTDDEEHWIDNNDEEPWTENEEEPNTDSDKGEPRIVNIEEPTIGNNEERTFLRIYEKSRMITDDEVPWMGTDYEEPMTDTDDEEHRIDSNDEEPLTYNYDEEAWHICDNEELGNDSGDQIRAVNDDDGGNIDFEDFYRNNYRHFMAMEFEPNSQCNVELEFSRDTSISGQRQNLIKSPMNLVDSGGENRIDTDKDEQRSENQTELTTVNDNKCWIYMNNKETGSENKSEYNGKESCNRPHHIYSNSLLSNLSYCELNKPSISMNPYVCKDITGSAGSSKSLSVHRLNEVSKKIRYFHTSESTVLPKYKKDTFEIARSSFENNLYRAKNCFSKRINRHNDTSPINLLDLGGMSLLDSRVTSIIPRLQKAKQLNYKRESEAYFRKLSVDSTNIIQDLHCDQVSNNPEKPELENTFLKMQEKCKRFLDGTKKTLHCVVCNELSKTTCCYYASYCSTECVIADLDKHKEICSKAKHNYIFNKKSIEGANEDMNNTIMGNADINSKDLRLCMKIARRSIIFDEDEEWLGFFRRAANDVNEPCRVLETDSSVESEAEFSDSNSNCNFFDHELPLEVILETYSNNSIPEAERDTPCNNNCISPVNINVEENWFNPLINCVDENTNAPVLINKIMNNKSTQTFSKVSINSQSEEIGATHPNTKCNKIDEEMKKLYKKQSISPIQCPSFAGIVHSQRVNTMTTTIVSTSLSQLKKFDIIFEPIEVKKFKMNRPEAFPMNHFVNIIDTGSLGLNPKENCEIVNAVSDLKKPEGMVCSVSSKISYNISNPNELKSNKAKTNLEVIFPKKGIEENNVKLPTSVNMKPGIRKILAKPHSNPFKPKAKLRSRTANTPENLVVLGESFKIICPLVFSSNEVGSSSKISQDSTTHHINQTKIDTPSVNHTTPDESPVTGSSDTLLIPDKCKKILASSTVSKENELLQNTMLPVIFPKPCETNVNTETIAQDSE